MNLAARPCRNSISIFRSYGPEIGGFNGWIKENEAEADCFKRMVEVSLVLDFFIVLDLNLFFVFGIKLRLGYVDASLNVKWNNYLSTKNGSKTICTE